MKNKSRETETTAVEDQIRKSMLDYWAKSDECKNLKLYISANSRDKVRRYIVKDRVQTCAEHAIIDLQWQMGDNVFYEYWPRVDEFAQELEEFVLPILPTE